MIYIMKPAGKGSSLDSSSSSCIFIDIVHDKKEVEITINSKLVAGCNFPLCSLNCNFFS